MRYQLTHFKSSPVLRTSSLDNNMELIHLLLLTTRFAVRQDVLWDIRCNSGSPNICELNDVMLTAEIADQRTFFPATNLRMIDGWIPVFDTAMAGMLRKETTVLVIMRCYVQYFVVREMLKVLILTSNAIRSVRLFESGDEFEMEFMKLDKNEISDISFVSRMEKLHYLDVSENKLQILNIELFQKLKNLNLLELRENQIKKIEASSMLTFPVELFGIANNQITDLNIKNWRAPNMTSFSVQINKLQSINTVQLLEALPKLTSFQYDENPWNCERLESLQFYIKMRPHKVYNFTRKYATCQDRDMVNNVALKLPELIDLSERRLGDLGGRIQQLIEGNGEGRQLASLQFRFAKTQQILGKMYTGLGKLENTHDKIKRNVDWLDFFDKLNW